MLPKGISNSNEIAAAAWPKRVKEHATFVGSGFPGMFPRLPDRPLAAVPQLIFEVNYPEIPDSSN